MSVRTKTVQATAAAPHFAVLARVDDADTVGDRDTRLGNVGRDDNLAHARRRRVEDGALALRGDATGRSSKMRSAQERREAGGRSGAPRMQREDDEARAAKDRVFLQHIVEPANLVAAEPRQGMSAKHEGSEEEQ